MGDLPVGKSERLGLGELFGTQWRHQREINSAIVSRKLPRVSRKLSGLTVMTRKHQLDNSAYTIQKHTIPKGEQLQSQQIPMREANCDDTPATKLPTRKRQP